MGFKKPRPGKYHSCFFGQGCVICLHLFICINFSMKVVSFTNHFHSMFIHVMCKKVQKNMTEHKCYTCASFAYVNGNKQLLNFNGHNDPSFTSPSSMVSSLKMGLHWSTAIFEKWAVTEVGPPIHGPDWWGCLWRCLSELISCEEKIMGHVIWFLLGVYLKFHVPKYHPLFKIHNRK